MTLTPVHFEDYRRIVFLTGAGISAASGLPTYRGAGGLWTTHDVASHATADAVRSDPRRVWDFFAAARALIAAASPNRAHVAIAQLERKLGPEQTAEGPDNLEPMVPPNPEFTEVVLGPAEVVLPELLGVG